MTEISSSNGCEIGPFQADGSTGVNSKTVFNFSVQKLLAAYAGNSPILNKELYVNMTLLKRDERFPEKGAALSAYKLQTHRYFTCAVNSF